jgi:hypothetical protein
MKCVCVCVCVCVWQKVSECVYIQLRKMRKSSMKYSRERKRETEKERKSEKSVCMRKMSSLNWTVFRHPKVQASNLLMDLNMNWDWISVSNLWEISIWMFCVWLMRIVLVVLVVEEVFSFSNKRFYKCLN